MRPVYKKGYALVLASAIMFNLTPTITRAQTRQAQGAETVYVGFIKDGERSVLFNQDWRFFKGDQSGAEATNFNDSSWRSLSLPHDWSIEGEFTTEGEAESGFLLGGTGWYRKHFVVPEKYEGKEFTLNFDGVYMNSEVYVNGKKIGENNYGYNAFAFDISDALVFDGQTENVIAVKVTNQIPSSRWYSGSGIYRDVTLTVTDSVHVSHLGSTVTTPNLEAQQGGNVDVNVSTTVENESSSEQATTLKSTVIDANGVAVSTPVTLDKNIATGESTTFEQIAVVNSPKLWSIDEPNLYNVKNEVIVNGEVVDTYFTEFGFRYYKLDKDTGFSLNGEAMKLQGVCMHHDQGSLGAASYYRAVERQMEIMKEMGVNAIRVTHNPASETLIEICNRLGLLVINEAFDTWTNPKNGNSNDFSKYFNQTIKTDNQIIGATEGMTWGEFATKAMVKGTKNDPSVIMWSIGNEILEGISGDSSKYTTIAQNIIDWIKEEDATRPVTIGDNNTKNGNAQAAAISDVVAKNGGIVGFNYTNDSQFATQRAKYPDWILYGSETSSAIHSRGYYKTVNRSAQSNSDLQIPEFDNNSNRVGWGHSASDAWKYTIKNDYNAGEFIWTGFDYIGEPTPWNGTGTGTVNGGKGAAPKSSYFGIVDTAGFEKDVYYLYQSQWNDKVNTLHILPTWNKEDIEINNGKVQVDVFTDAYKVELYLNGNKIGEQTATEHVTPAGYKYYTFGNDALYPTFNVTYAEGTLSAKAYDKDGNEITNTQGRKSVKTSGVASNVKLSADKTTIDSDGYDLSYITVDITDKNGNFVSSASNSLNFTLEGNGKIVGVDNGNAADTASYKPTNDTTATRKAFSGKALVIVQSTKDSGAMTLNVSGEGLESKSITVNTVNNAGDNKYLESYDVVKEYYLGLGEEPALPKTVVGRYSDGTTGTFNVQWNEYDKELLNTPQVFKITGKLEGTEAAVAVNVHVTGDIVSMENYSTFTYVNTTPTLPATVKGYLANGEEAEDYKVTWDLANADFSVADTIVTVNGKVDLLGKEYPVTANVRVAAALKTARNLAINKASENNDIPTLSQSPIKTADNLASINNGITNSTDANERWTNWNERDEVVNGEPKGAYVQLDWKNKYDIDRLDLWLFTDNLSGRIPKKVEISYKDDKGEYVVAPHSNTTEVSYTSGETTYLLNKVVNTDSIRIYMQQPASGNCIGLTEVKVYQYNPKVTANTTNTLSEIKLNGNLLEGFDPSKNEYTVNVNKLPEKVEATAIDNATVTILPIYNNKSIIIVRAEDGSKNIYTVNYMLPELNETDKTLLEMVIKYAEDAKSNGALENVIPAVVNEFEAALEEAKTIFGDKKVTEVQVDLAIDRLINVIHMLEFNKGDKTELTKLVEIVNALDENKYTPSTWNELKAELKNANDVIANENAMEAEVAEAHDQLSKAYKNLVLAADKSKLLKLVSELDAKDTSKYTTGSVNKFNSELDNAKTVLDNVEATQEQINEAYNKLVKSYLDLRLIPDKSKLEELINKAEAIDVSKYTRASVDRLNTNLAKVKDVLNNEDATEEEVNKASEGLELALAGLELAQAGTNTTTNNNNNNGNDGSSNNGNTNNGASNTNNSTSAGKGNANSNLPSTGSPIAPITIMLASLGLVALGTVMFRKRSKLN